MRFDGYLYEEKVRRKGVILSSSLCKAISYKQLTMFWQLWFSVHSLILLLEILCVQKYLACLLLMFSANMNMFFCCTIAILHFLSSKCMLLDPVALTNEEHWCFLPNQSSDVVDILIVLLSLLLGLPLLHSCATIILDDTYIFGWDLDRFLFPYDECGPSGSDRGPGVRPSVGRWPLTSYITPYIMLTIERPLSSS